jgi:hypothetical protein
MSWKEAKAMFDELDKQIAKEEGANSTPVERAARYTAIAIISLIVFGALIWGVWLLEY